MRIKRIKAFTILEALFSMLILSVIVALTYSLFSLLNKQMALFEKENAEIIQYNLFNSTIINDADKANDYSVENDRVSFKYYDESTIKYTFKMGFVLRESSMKTDTLRVNIRRFEYFKINEVKGRADLELTLLNETFNVHYVLNKTNAEVINKKFFNED